MKKYRYKIVSLNTNTGSLGIIPIEFIYFVIAALLITPAEGSSLRGGPDRHDEYSHTMGIELALWGALLLGGYAYARCMQDNSRNKIRNISLAFLGTWVLNSLFLQDQINQAPLEAPFQFPGHPHSNPYIHLPTSNWATVFSYFNESNFCDPVMTDTLHDFCSTNHFSVYFAYPIITTTRFEGASESYRVFENSLTHFMRSSDSPFYKDVETLYNKSFNRVPFETKLQELKSGFSFSTDCLKWYTDIQTEDKQSVHAIQLANRAIFNPDVLTTLWNISSPVILNGVRNDLRTLKYSDTSSNTDYFPLVGRLSTTLERYVQDPKSDPLTVKSLQENNLKKQLVDFFQFKGKFLKFVKDLSDTINKLKVGHFLVIPGGWDNPDGGSHSVAYVIKRTERTTIQLTILNKGLRVGGPTFEPPQNKHGVDLTYLERVFEFSGNNNQDLHEYLTEMLIAKAFPDKSHVPFKIYNYINGLTFFEKKEQALLGLGASSGTCNKDAPELAFDLLTDHADYGKLMSFGFQAQYLHSFLTQQPSEIGPDKVPVDFIQEAQKKVLTNAKGLYEASLLSDAGYSDILVLSQKLDLFMEMFKYKMIEPTNTDAGIVQPPKETPLYSLVNQLITENSPSIYRNIFFRPRISPRIFTDHVIPDQPIQSIEQLLDHMSQFELMQADNFDRTSGLSSSAIFHELLNQLSIKPLLTKSTTLGISTDSLKNLIQIADTYSEILALNRLNPEIYSAVIPYIKLLIWCDAGLRQTEGSPISKLRFELTSLTGLSFEELVIKNAPLDVHLYQDIQDILAYSAQHSHHKRGPLFGMEINPDGKTLIDKKIRQLTPEQYPLIEYIEATQNETDSIRKIADTLYQHPLTDSRCDLYIENLFLGLQARYLLTFSALDKIWRFPLDSPKSFVYAPSPDTLIIGFVAYRRGQDFRYSVESPDKTTEQFMNTLPGWDVSLGNAITSHHDVMTLNTLVMPSPTKKALFTIFQPGLSLVETLGFSKEHSLYFSDRQVYLQIKKQLTKATKYEGVFVPILVENMLKMNLLGGFIEESLTASIQTASELKNIKIFKNLVDLYIMIYEGFELIQDRFSHDFNPVAFQGFKTLGDTLLTSVRQTDASAELCLIIQQTMGLSELFIQDMLTFSYKKLKDGIPGKFEVPLKMVIALKQAILNRPPPIT